MATTSVLDPSITFTLVQNLAALRAHVHIWTKAVDSPVHGEGHGGQEIIGTVRARVCLSCSVCEGDVQNESAFSPMRKIRVHGADWQKFMASAKRVLQGIGR